MLILIVVPSFFFNDPATTEIYTLSLHDALPICRPAQGQCRPAASHSVDRRQHQAAEGLRPKAGVGRHQHEFADRKSTRLNSSHPSISYAVFCLKKKKRT